MSRQTVCDQCGEIVKEGLRVKLEGMFQVMHANLSGYTSERRKLDFCERACLRAYVDEHEEMR